MGIIKHDVGGAKNEFSIVYDDNYEFVEDGGIIIFAPERKSEEKKSFYLPPKKVITMAEKNAKLHNIDIIENIPEIFPKTQEKNDYNINVKDTNSYKNTNKVENNTSIKNTNIHNTNTQNTNTQNNNINTNTNTTPDEPVEPEEPDIDLPGQYWVNHKRLIWEDNCELGIFKNPKYNMDSIIAPGSTNSYVFYVNNKMGFDLNYIMDFSEENDMNVNMMYKLKREDEYIVGDENTWEYYDKLHIDFDIADQGKDKYVLEWKWVDADNDTYVGTNHAREIYKLIIDVTVTQISGFEEEPEQPEETENSENSENSENPDTSESSDEPTDPNTPSEPDNP